MPITRKKFTLPLALAAAGLLSGVPVAASAFATPAATAATPVVYQTTLKALNGSGASGTVKISLDGNNATVTEHVSGLAAKFGDGAYPHVQHIHIDGKGACPLPSADKNDDQLVDRALPPQPTFLKLPVEIRSTTAAPSSSTPKRPPR